MSQFYQDTLETDEPSKEESESKTETGEAAGKKEEDGSEETPAEGGSRGNTPVDDAEGDGNSRDGGEKAGDGESQATAEEDGAARESGKPRGVLVIHSQMKNRRKKSIRWRPDDELEMHHFFELDETERGK